MSVTSNAQIARDNKERWHRYFPKSSKIDRSLYENKTAYRLHQNCIDGPNPREFENCVALLGRVHHLFLTFQRVPDDNEGVTWKFIFKSSNAIQNKFGVLVGGRSSKSQRLVKSLSDTPTDEGRGSTFSWDSLLLSSALDMLEELLRPISSESSLLAPQLLGTEPPMPLWVSALHEVINSPGENLFKSSVSGVVSHVPAEDAQNGSIRVIPKCDVDGSLLKENVDKPDEIPLLPGTRSCVKVGEEVVLGQVVLCPDVSKLSRLSLEELGALRWYVEQSGFPEEAKLFELAAHIRGVPLYAGGKGELYEDVSQLCSEIQVVDREGPRIFSDGGSRLDAENVRYDLKHIFTCLPSRDLKRQQARQQVLQLRRKGYAKAWEIVLREAIALPDAAVQNKMAYVFNTFPFAPAEELRKKMQTFDLQTRYNHGSLQERATIMNEFLEKMLDENTSSASRAS